MPFTAVAEKVITASVLKAPLLPKEPAFIIPRPAVRLMPFNLGNRLPCRFPASGCSCWSTSRSLWATRT